MSLFGSREDDPLLQNDPLAPSNSNAEKDRGLDPKSDEDEDPENDCLAGESVFGESAEYRVIRSEHEAANGHLDELHELIDHGWSLHHIEIEDPPSRSSGRWFVFVFRRSGVRRAPHGRPDAH